jgi:hypothetical protein
MADDLPILVIKLDLSEEDAATMRAWEKSAEDLRCRILVAGNTGDYDLVSKILMELLEWPDNLIHLLVR